MFPGSEFYSGNREEGDREEGDRVCQNLHLFVRVIPLLVWLMMCRGVG